mmetsp:Transcript_7539/g.15644  ORF Transcript_7539/g.15644 Transcript_7539/m.15644 type:complete len:243 (-) Transcript_7539:230-958(-)|eukprot:CAMPEP_0194306724 /NCGR_PEP_ID=MMETSP0171-20130528/3768_1 /TAXON_ID=218684 /ORGANISM="Corethron pennatum, Strain L29A3" /LENGTH=242 /DNA_ID=CAMNT_0039058563 /DNA_START=19 /DNA_END=747 /DNA_ORIENTATION=+
MTIIVFACKSNSCRSQMAEGWAQKWIQDKLNVLKSTLQEFKDKEDEKDERWGHMVEKHISLLENTVVLSVALDSSVVFDDNSTSAKTVCPLNDYRARKQVKAKALEVMAKYGVDISLHQPKTVNEILPVLLTKEAQADFMETQMAPPIRMKQFKTLEHGVIEVTNSPEPPKSVDKLIVLCSCGEEIKYELTRRSKSVDEWSIDAPTTASKAGEGDQAYQRVSLEIKKEVHILMGNLLTKPCL